MLAPRPPPHEVESVLLIAFLTLYCSRVAAQPNVLFNAVDDPNDRAGCLGGHPQTKSPNIDQLAKSGVLFTNVHCPAPACNPSRLIDPAKLKMQQTRPGAVWEIRVPDGRALGGFRVGDLTARAVVPAGDQ